MLELALREPQSNFVGWIFKHSIILIHLCDMFGLAGVYSEVLICHDDFAFPVVYLFLFGFLELSHHIITRDEDGLKEGGIREGLRYGKLGLEDLLFTIFLRRERCIAFQSSNFVLQLLYIRNTQVI